MVGNANLASLVEPLHDGEAVRQAQALSKGLTNGFLDDALGDRMGPPQLSLVLQLQLPGDGWERRVDVGRARNDSFFPIEDGTALGIRDRILHARDREPLADP